MYSVKVYQELGLEKVIGKGLCVSVRIFVLKKMDDPRT